MEISFEGKNILVAQGQVAPAPRGTAIDGFVPRLRLVIDQFAKLQKEYGLALAQDQKILGQERVMLIERCDRMILDSVASLHFGLYQDLAPASLPPVTAAAADLVDLVAEAKAESTASPAVAPVVAPVVAPPVRAPESAAEATDYLLTIPGYENVFMVRRSGIFWSLRERIQPGLLTSIREMLKDLVAGPVSQLLREMHGLAADGQISQAERHDLLPTVLRLALAVLELRYQIESCVTSN
ncbi:MAG: hypothetical protein A2087_01325 [Spirochaetes bacterium GWD1_61_31]|nr:MAG: hypothetical protein A2Y37_04975 [Spirochaetes bacterium GWB1_60_80]OHD32489.1 MAG: hypothetical protein A2004_12210 [Spirochaetes bacterium GWC1_61_12]OHD35307.1 MAG: hypothetical protein A2087_01325 [Spirochaetes bacterium GWD1_61_31]OHD43727.1 MAG: hypothetical protein A2Y35_00165 [Spirochaetes bacterium GWE1_60_18]OHD60212.1 MAG: hypothetical protein A2Y32_07215 [Spirochaetes bacterium GWF1_60_12]HAP42560.1 hypothetical protein [Spirochaetaceae bacterium]